MSNEITSSNRLATAGNKISIVNNELSSGLSSAVSSIRLLPRREKFEIIDSGDVVCEVSELECVIIAAGKLSGKFYDTDYTPTAESRPPTCHSVNGVTPDSTIRNPQSQFCCNCPRKVWGSKGKKGRECPDYRRLVVGILCDGEYKIFRFDVPPLSLKNLAAFRAKITTARFYYYEILTRITYEPDTEFTKLVFTPVKALKPELRSMIEQIRVEPIVNEILTAEVRSDAREDELDDEPAKPKATATKQRKVNTTKEEDDDDKNSSIFKDDAETTKDKDQYIFGEDKAEEKVTKSKKRTTAPSDNIFEINDEDLDKALDEQLRDGYDS